MDWYPWGDEAFAKARRENKPVYLSIGYSTCHWCHVMERESFDNAEIAALLNKEFVAIKVDREERPDIDSVYQDAASAAGWDGGWPLNLWLTPRLQPFFGGTYFPPEAREGRPGLKEVLARVAELWRTKREDAIKDAEQIAAALSSDARAEAREGAPDAAILDAGFKAYRDAFTPEQGGFGGAPKFPMPVNQGFLLRYYARTGNKKALDMALLTLRKMSEGGVYDQLGGGFHRYATDAEWRSPHFEKMLYDNAQLAVNYLEAYQASGDARPARTARETLDYLLRDLARPEGGFYSAEDADGAFYMWRRDELLRVLGEKAGSAACAGYGVEVGDSVLHAAKDAPAPGARELLLQARSKRPRPKLDDKILAGWNGLALSALAKGAQVFDEPRYRQAAEKAALFLRDNLYDPKTNRLYRRWREGERAVAGMAEDYAFMAAGLLDLYEATFDPQWLDWAIRLTQAQLELFYDPRGGVFYTTAPGQDENLIVRPFDANDGVLPAASSVSTLNLLRLRQLTDREDFAQAARKTLRRFGAQMASRPASLPFMLGALDFSLSKTRRIVIAGVPGAADTAALLREIRRRYLPNAVVILTDDGPMLKYHSKALPFLNKLRARKGRATAYVCSGTACDLPTSDPMILGRILDGKKQTTHQEPSK